MGLPLASTHRTLRFPGVRGPVVIRTVVVENPRADVRSPERGDGRLIADHDLRRVGIHRAPVVGHGENDRVSVDSRIHMSDGGAGTGRPIAEVPVVADERAVGVVRAHRGKVRRGPGRRAVRTVGFRDGGEPGGHERAEIGLERDRRRRSCAIAAAAQCVLCEGGHRGDRSGSRDTVDDLGEASG
jgi:hypothetical protein